jgi:hypothetical protein
MSILNYAEMLIKNHLLYDFADEIEEKISSYILVIKVKYKK